jgi:PAS domain S-box-containing protein
VNEADRRLLLLVEGDADAAASEQAALEALGYSAIVAGSAGEALDAFRKLPSIALVLMDLDLGESPSSLETAAAMLEERETPIVFQSSGADQEKIARAGRMGSYGFLAKGSGAAALDAAVKMALRLFATVQELRESRERLNQIVSKSSEMICEVDEEGRYTFVNDRCEELLGHKPEELIGRYSGDFLHAEDLEPAVARHAAVRSEEGTSVDRWRIRDGRGDYKVIECRASIYRSKEGRRMTVVAAHDVTEGARAEAALRESESRFQGLLRDVERVAIQGYGPDGTTQYWNPASERIYGYTEKEALGRNLLDLIIPDEMKDGVKEAIRQMAETGQPIPASELSLKRKDGSRVAVFSSHTVLKRPGRGPELFCVDVDLFDIKQAERRIQRLLEEKEILLKEVHHRVKNSMATIQSLLGLQAGATREPTAATALNEAASRVRSMMLLYDKLHQAESFEAVSLQHYLSPLVDDVLGNFPGCDSVRVEKDIDDFPLDARRMQEVGIIVNELLTNIMKYAFKAAKGGRIWVTAKKDEGRVRIGIADDGSGLPDSVDFERSSGLGLVLVKALAKQLDGTIALEREKGTKIVLEFNS